MTEHNGLIFIIISGASFIIAYWLIDRSFSDAWAFMKVNITPNMSNDDASAIDKLVPLVEEAEATIEIYDDGENFPESMYNDEYFVSTVEEKLRTSNIKIKCLFNEDDDLLFTHRLGKNPQVSIYTRVKGGRSQTHYKIIDGGLKAYLSVHIENESRDRAFKEVDCSKVPKRKMAMVADTLFEDIRQNERNFKKKEIVN